MEAKKHHILKIKYEFSERHTSIFAEAVQEYCLRIVIIDSEKLTPNQILNFI